MSLQSIENKFYFDLWAESHPLMTVTFFWRNLRGDEMECRLHNTTYNKALAVAKSMGYIEPKWYNPLSWLNGVVTVG